VTISRVGFGTVGAGISTMSVGFPPGIAAFDLLLILSGDKYVAPNTPTCTAGTWVLSSDGLVSGGAGSPGVDSGTVFASCYQRQAAVGAGTTADNAVCTVTGGNTMEGFQVAFRSTLVAAGTHRWFVQCASGSDNSSDATWAVTAGVDPNIAAGDYVIALSAINGNGPGASWWSAEILSASGVTFGSVFVSGDIFTNNGDDMAMRYQDAIATAGASTAPPSLAMTASTGAWNPPTGCTIFIRIREVPLFNDAVGTAAGTGAATGAALPIISAVGTAAGTSTATGVGETLSFGDAVGTAAGTSSASASTSFSSTAPAPPGTIAHGDYALVWADGVLDMTMADDDLASDQGLRTAVLLSLFTDRRAEDDDALPADDGDRRGWWADEFAETEGDLMGSRLWLLDRSTRRVDVARRAEEFIREALAWPLEDKVAARLDVEVETTATEMLIAVTAHRPQGDPVSFRFAHVWATP
jgi:phage gp46-like protein